MDSAQPGKKDRLGAESRSTRRGPLNAARSRTLNKWGQGPLITIWACVRPYHVALRISLGREYHAYASRLSSGRPSTVLLPLITSGARIVCLHGVLSLLDVWWAVDEWYCAATKQARGPNSLDRSDASLLPIYVPAACIEAIERNDGWDSSSEVDKEKGRSDEEVESLGEEDEEEGSGEEEEVDSGRARSAKRARLERLSEEGSGREEGGGVEVAMEEVEEEEQARKVGGAASDSGDGEDAGETAGNEEDNDDGGLLEIEAICGHLFNRDLGRWELHIQWAGDEEASWEPEVSVRRDRSRYTGSLPRLPLAIRRASRLLLGRVSTRTGRRRRRRAHIRSTAPRQSASQRAERVTQIQAPVTGRAFLLVRRSSSLSCSLAVRRRRSFPPPRLPSQPSSEVDSFAVLPRPLLPFQSTRYWVIGYIQPRRGKIREEHAKRWLDIEAQFRRALASIPRAHRVRALRQRYQPWQLRHLLRAEMRHNLERCPYENQLLPLTCEECAEILAAKWLLWKPQAG